MAHKTLIRGTAYDITGGKTLASGTSYSIKNGKTRVSGTEYDIGFGVPISTLAVGDSVYFNVNGVSKEFFVVHQGLPSDIYDISCHGAWLLMKDIYENRSFDTIQPGYETSAIHKYLNESFFGLLDLSVQAGIRQVKIPYVHQNDAEIGGNGVETKIFLLSVIELGIPGNTSTIVPEEGSRLDYFISGTSSDALERRIAKLNGSPSPWWTRSRLRPYIGNVWNIQADGRTNAKHYTTSLGIRPAFILSGDFRI